MTILLSIIVFACVLKLTGFFFKLFGKIIGLAFGLIGYILMGVLAVTVFGLATIFAPIIIIVGICAVIALIAGLAKKA